MRSLVLLSEMQVFAFYLQSYLLQLFATNICMHTHICFYEARVSVCVCV